MIGEFESDHFVFSMRLMTKKKLSGSCEFVIGVKLMDSLNGSIKTYFSQVLIFLNRKNESMPNAPKIVLDLIERFDQNIQS